MRTAPAIPAAILLTALATAGCVDRRFIIETNVPNAQIYIDNQPIGTAPVDTPFTYYGYYNVTIVHPNFATTVKRMRVRPPWYAYPPFDFFVEVLWPFRVEDVRRYFFKLEPILQVPNSVLVENAEQLRQRGWALPAPKHPPLAPQAALPGDPLPPGSILEAPTPTAPDQPVPPAENR